MKITCLSVASMLSISAVGWSSMALKAEAAYFQTNLVSNSPTYQPQLLDPLLQRSRSIAIRPAGLGGHFWINNLANGTNTVYVGDVGGVPIFQDALTFVDLPPSPSNTSGISSPTGQVFNNSQEFVITIDHPNGPITTKSKFLFGSLDGTITAWTDRTGPNGVPDWPTKAVLVVDRFGESVYQGVTVSDLSTNNRLYAVDFGIEPRIEVFDKAFNEITSSVVFSNPFASEGYGAYNIQTFNGSLYVTYAKPSATFVGEGEPGVGLGRLAQFDFDGNLLSIWDDDGLLNVPAGIAIAPSDFGEFSNALLVANFGDGTVVGFDRTTRQPLGYLKDFQNNPVVIPGIWGLTFGNGASLGETNHLYFSADPSNGTNNGLFGKLEYQSVPESNSVIGVLAISGLGLIRFCTKTKK